MLIAGIFTVLMIMIISRAITNGDNALSMGNTGESNKEMNYLDSEDKNIMENSGRYQSNFKKIKLKGKIIINYYSLDIEKADITIITSNISMFSRGLDISVEKNNEIKLLGFNGTLEWRDSRFVLRGKLKEYNDDRTNMKINDNNEFIFEVNDGMLYINEIMIKKFNGFASGNLNINDKIDFELTNDNVSLENYIGSFSLNKDDVVEINGKVDDAGFNIKDIEVNLR